MFVINMGNLKTKLKYHISKKTLNLSKFSSRCGHEYKKAFKEKQSIEILKILNFINNMEENQKIYDHAWRIHKPRIQTEKKKMK